MGTVISVILCFVILAAVFFAVRAIRRKKSCCGNCSYCSGCGTTKKKT